MLILQHQFGMLNLKKADQHKQGKIRRNFWEFPEISEVTTLLATL